MVHLWWFEIVRTDESVPFGFRLQLLVGCGGAQIQLRVIIVALANHFDCVTNGIEKNMQE
jgi:hypothetical protein